MRISTDSPEKTMKVGEKIGRHLKEGDIIGLVGELGSGKTTLVKGIACGLRVKDRKGVVSPSFVLIKEYAGRIPLFHFDLYRLDKIKDIENLGITDYLFDHGVCVIEWAEKAKFFLADYLEIKLKIKGAQKRELTFVAHGRGYENTLFRHLK